MRSARSNTLRVLTAATMTVGISALGISGAVADTNYEVRSGDTLTSIAGDTGADSWRDLFDANADVIDDPALIFPGQVLSVPGSGGSNDADSGGSNDADSGGASDQQAETTSSAPAPSGNTGVWDRLAQCESGGDWDINTGNGYYGGLQFAISSWQAVGGSGLPSDAPRSEQIARAEQLQAIQGWGAWPACSAELGLR